MEFLANLFGQVLTRWLEATNQHEEQDFKIFEYAEITIATCSVIIALAALVYTARSSARSERFQKITTRCYVTIHRADLRISYDNKSCRAILILKNTGNTPTVSAISTITCQAIPYGQTIVPAASHSEMLPSPIGPGQEITVYLDPADFGSPLVTIDDLMKNQIKLVLTGHVTYEDVYGQQHRLEVTASTKPIMYQDGEYTDGKCMLFAFQPTAEFAA